MAMGKLPDDHGGEESGGIFAEINITPLTDIFLVLLIIFMVTTSIAKDAGSGGLNVTLPQGGSAEAAKVDAPMDIFLVKMEPAGTPPLIMIEGKELSKAELDSRLKTEIKKNPQLVVRVRADEKIIHKHVVEVLDLVRGAGVTRLSIATQVKTASSP